LTTWKVNNPSSGPEPRPALFLDRDGVVITQEHYLADPALVRLLPGVAEAMIKAQRAGFLLIGVSNQSGIGRGFFSMEDFGLVMERLEELLAAEGTGFDSFHYCPHGPAAECDCRKPRPGMLREAMAHFPIDLENSWMIGDKGSDVAFGRAAGMGAILVRTGYGTGEENKVQGLWNQDEQVMVVDDLQAAVNTLVGLIEKGGPS
jgi:D-glycero-D-manno-heptose 1,7-bisphosphate phosphatase